MIQINFDLYVSNIIGNTWFALYYKKKKKLCTYYNRMGTRLVKIKLVKLRPVKSGGRKWKPIDILIILFIYIISRFDKSSLI